MGGTDPVLSLPLFANDDLASALGFTNPVLFNTPILNSNPSPQLFDWVKDTLVNNDPPSLVNTVATGIQLGQTGTYFEGQPRGHWYGLRFVDGIGNLDRDVFVKGGKEDSPSQWIIGPGSVGSAKYDITQAFLADTVISTTDLADFPDGREHILYFEMERRGNDGTTAFDFEFNQLPPAGPYIPTRSEGDVLFTFEVNGSSTSGTATPHVYLYHNGNFLSNELYVSQFPTALQPIMGLNEVDTPSEPWGFVNSKGNWTIGQIPKFSVAEAAVPFAIQSGLGPCLGHKAFMQLRTRSSASQTSDLKDVAQCLFFNFDQPVEGTANLLGNSSSQELFYSATATGGLPPYQYVWSFYLQGFSNPIGTSTSQSGVFTVPSPGTYYARLQIMDSFGPGSCGFATETPPVTITASTTSFLSRFPTYATSG